MKIHEKIPKTLSTRQNGLGTTYPNPLVGGDVIVFENQIIGELA
jgi:diaminohydroxyphosphoribosylaminopyrimidine deaminase/5-amino-6-(5-phosphoribosylamino)uracil reductase